MKNTGLSSSSLIHAYTSLAGSNGKGIRRPLSWEMGTVVEKIEKWIKLCLRNKSRFLFLTLFVLQERTKKKSKISQVLEVVGRPRDVFPIRFIDSCPISI